MKILSEITNEDHYGKNVEKTLMLFKEYIRGTSSFRKELAEKKPTVHLKAQESKRKPELFLGDEVRSTMSSFQGVIATDVKKVTDEAATIF